MRSTRNEPSLITSDVVLRCLRFVYKRVGDITCRWAVTGGASLLIHGVQSVAHDIDILCSEECAELFYISLQEFALTYLEYSEIGNVRSLFCRYIVSGVRLEVMANVSNRLADRCWHENRLWQDFVEYVRIGDLRIPVLSLEYEQDIAGLLGQATKVSLIENYRGHK